MLHSLSGAPLELVVDVEREVRVDEVTERPLRLDLDQARARALVRGHAPDEPVQALRDRDRYFVAGWLSPLEPLELGKKSTKLHFSDSISHFVMWPKRPAKC